MINMFMEDKSQSTVTLELQQKWRTLSLFSQTARIVFTQQGRGTS